MLTPPLIRFLDRLVIADKSFASVADKQSIVFFSAADAEPRFPSSDEEAGEGGFLLKPAEGSEWAGQYPFGIRIPAEIERRGVDAIEALAYDQALICSCSLARADFAPFEEDFILDDERKSTLEAARVYRSTMAEAHPDEPPEAVRALLRFTVERPAELSPLTLLQNMIGAGAGRVLLFHTPETGTIIAEVSESDDTAAVFADYSDFEEAYGLRITMTGMKGRLIRGYHVTGNTVRIFSEEPVSEESQTGTLTAQTLFSLLY